MYCKRERIKPQQTFICELPVERLDTYKKPFCNTGTGFFGLIIVKPSKITRANQIKPKRFGVIFTRMTTHGIYLEIVGDLTTHSFSLALCHFIACQGNVTHIRSGDGTNFKGAQKEYQEDIIEISIPNVVPELLKKYVDFICTFNPPSCPWIRGAWEALTNLLVTKEALHTFICEVESILNNRPIPPAIDNINIKKY